MKYNLTELNSIIRNRRMVKPEFFSGEPVEEELIFKLLENARWAPTHGLTQPWRFTVYSGDGLVYLAESQARIYKAVTSSEKFNPKKYEKLKARPLMASAVIAICMKRQESGKIPSVEEAASVACAVQNMCLTATAMGIASYWSSGGVTYTKELKDFLELGEKDKCFGFLYLGKTVLDISDTGRNPVDNFTTFVRKS